MTRLQPLVLSSSQAQSFKKAYANGEVDTEVMFNLFNYMPRPPAVWLNLLTVPRLDPVHFNFTGNRPYQNQIVSNGEACAILSHERLSKKDQDKPAINIVRMEVITRVDLPFLKASEPTERQLRQLHADFVEWVVDRFNGIKATWPEDAVGFAMSMAQGHDDQQDAVERDKILAGEDPREVLSQWIEGGSPDSLLVRAVPAFRRRAP